jgi:hypothetical protein
MDLKILFSQKISKEPQPLFKIKIALVIFCKTKSLKYVNRNTLFL